MQGLNIILVCYFVNIIIINFLLYYILSKIKKHDKAIAEIKNISESIKRHEGNNYKNIEIFLMDITYKLDQIEINLDKNQKQITFLKNDIDNLKKKAKKTKKIIINKIKNER